MLEAAVHGDAPLGLAPEDDLDATLLDHGLADRLRPAAGEGENERAGDENAG
jgi:hypothetical protein